MIVRRSALLAQPAGHLFDVIEAAEHYPRFLPWCVGAVILSRDETLVSADLHVRLAGLNFEMRTRNPKRRPEYMAIHLERGPFRRFEGEWQLTVLAPDACKVAFMLDYDFESGFMTRAAGPMFKHIADTLMDAFIRHAQSLPVAAQAATASVAAAQAATASVAAAQAATASAAAVQAAAPPLAAAQDAAAPLAATQDAMPPVPVAQPRADQPPAIAAPPCDLPCVDPGTPPAAPVS